jgi:protein Mpv17
MTRMILKPFNLYEKAIVNYPVRTAMITGSLVATAGDYVCQRLTNKDKSYDYKRGLRYALIASSTSPVVLFWYRFLNRRFNRLYSKLAMDQFIFSPIDIMYCFAANTFLIGGDIYQLKSKIYNDLPSTYCGNMLFWTTALSVNFSIIPLNYRLLFSNGCSFLYNIYLSYKVNK